MGDAMDALEAAGAKYGMGQYRYPSSHSRYCKPHTSAKTKRARSRQDPKNIFEVVVAERSQPKAKSRKTAIPQQLLLDRR